MGKLGRNAMADCKLFSKKGDIKQDAITKLIDLQNKEGLTCSKLSNRHAHFYKEKMKVKLAVQTLSKSTADSLKFLEEDLHLPQFKGSGATAEYRNMFNELFDFLNVRRPFSNKSTEEAS